MRNVIAVVLSATLVLLVTVPQEAVSFEPITVAKAAVGVLTPFIKGYMSDLKAKREAEKIKIRLWMHNGDPKLNGCGFYFQVNGFAGGTASGYFPSKTEHRCGDKKYEMRMTSQSAMYDKQIHLGNQQAKRVEVHADGWHNTFVRVMCIGFNERTIAGGPRAFCINNDLLKACKGLMHKWNDINIEYNDIIMTRTNRGIHKILFRDIHNLVNAYERLDRNINDVDAVWTVCDRIDLVRGTDRDDNWTCSAHRRWIEPSGAFDYGGAWLHRSQVDDKSPYGCERNENRK